MKWKRLPASQFRALASDWDRLCERVAPAAPFLGSAFIGPLLTHFGSGNECIVLGEDSTGVKAIAVMRPVRFGIWETFQPSQLPLGAILLDRSTDTTEVAADLMRALPGFAVSAGLTQLDPLLCTRPADSGQLETLDYIETAWVPVTGTFEAYWEARGKNLRHNIRKQRSKLSEQGITPRLETLTQASDVAGVLAHYGAMESGGWKAAGGTAIHPDNAQGRFYAEMLANFCATNQCRLYRYWFNDKVAAIDLCITGGDSIVILKTTYDESYQGFSPAFLMRHEAFADIFREGTLRRIEFFGKVMDWHKRWTDEWRTLYHVTCYRWPWLLRLKKSRAQRRAAQGDAPATSSAAPPREQEA